MVGPIVCHSVKWTNGLAASYDRQTRPAGAKGSLPEALESRQAFLCDIGCGGRDGVSKEFETCRYLCTLRLQGMMYVLDVGVIHVHV